MNKKISFGLILILMLLVTACGKDTYSPNSPQPASSSNQAESSQPQKGAVEAPKSNLAQVEEALTSFQGDQPAKMSGNGNKEFKLAMHEGGYKLVMKTKDLTKGLKGLDLVSASSNIGVPMFASAGAGKSDADWYVYERVERMYSTDDTIFKVQATGPYAIEVYKLPLPSGNVALPLSIKGKGTKALGPFATSSPLVVKLKTSDAKNAGFMVNLADAITGEQAESVYMNVDMSTQKIINNVDVSQKLTPSSSNSCLLKIEANGNCEWEVEISN